VDAFKSVIRNAPRLEKGIVSALIPILELAPTIDKKTEDKGK
jgi:hypothetical protein